MLTINSNFIYHFFFTSYEGETSLVLVNWHEKRATDRIWTGDLILTKDALYQLSYCSFLLRSVGLPLALLRFSLSGRRGSNPPPIAWKAIALPNELLPLLSRFVGKSGLEPLNSEEDRFTVCCNCHYATSPFAFPMMPVDIRGSSSSRWRDSNPRQADYKSATLPTELHRLFQLCQTTLCFLDLRLQRYYFFLISQIFFLFFFKLFSITLIIIPIFPSFPSPLHPVRHCFLPVCVIVYTHFRLCYKASDTNNHIILC